MARVSHARLSEQEIDEVWVRLKAGRPVKDTAKQFAARLAGAPDVVAGEAGDQPRQVDDLAQDRDPRLRLLDVGGQRRIAGVDVGEPVPGLVDRDRGPAEMGVELGGRVRELVAAGLQPAEVLGGRL